MGMLTSFLSGASQGLNVLGQGMARGVEREQEQSIWEKRQALLAQIQRESAKNLRDDEFAARNDPTNVATEITTATTKAEAAGKVARGQKVAELTDPDLVAAQDADSQRAGAREREKTKQAAADPIYMGAVKAIKLADPEVAARIAASRAQVAESGARTGLLGQQIASAKLDVKDKERLGKLYDQASAVLSDAGMDDTQRAKKFAGVQREITLLKSKNGAAGGVDKELDTVTVEDTTINPDGSTSKTTRKEVRKPGAPAAGTGSGPAVGQEVNGFVFKGGDPNVEANWSKKEGKSASSSSPAARKQSSAPLDQFAAMNDRTLRQLAGTAGHTSQAAAKAELERRAAAAQQESAEYGSAASQAGYSGP